MEFSPVAVMDNGRGLWELVMVRTTCQIPLKLCSDYSCQFEGELETTRNEFVHLLLSSTMPLFFWSSNFFTFSKSIRGNAYTISRRTGSPFWWKWGFKLKSRGEGEGKNGMGSFRCTPPLPPTSLFFASNFFLSYTSLEPNPSLTHFVGMKNIRQALLASCLSAC